MKKEGFALVITLLILVILTIIMIGVFQESALDMLMAQNSIDQPESVQGALTCEAQKIADARHPAPQIQLRDYSLHSTNPRIQCQSHFVQSLGRPAGPIPGASVNIANITVLRFRTQATGRRGTQATILTDIPVLGAP